MGKKIFVTAYYTLLGGAGACMFWFPPVVPFLLFSACLLVQHNHRKCLKKLESDSVIVRTVVGNMLIEKSVEKTEGPKQ